MSVFGTGKLPVPDSNSLLQMFLKSDECVADAGHTAKLSGSIADGAILVFKEHRQIVLAKKLQPKFMTIDFRTSTQRRDGPGPTVGIDHYSHAPFGSSVGR